jgi:hypothetical protein
MKKLYRLNMTDIQSLNIAHLNPTMKAIVKGMYRLEKRDLNPTGMTGDAILEFCVNEGLWSTRQDPDKFHTTWAYYVKKLKEECQVLEVGTIKDTSEEYLE